MLIDIKTATMPPLENDKMCNDSVEMREMAARICRDYLHGAWKQVSAQDIGFKRISGGLSNWLYHVWLPSHLASSETVNSNENCAGRRYSRSNSQEEEPSQVLLRIYGQVHGDRALEHLITESVIFTLLSERRLGPRLHGVFPGGRIEQYIDARPLLTRELALPELSVQIARKMAAIHAMDVPVSKEPNWLWNTADRWLNTIEATLTKSDKNAQHAEQILKVKSYDLRSELRWLRTYLTEVKSPVVFCHNDMQEGNILVCSKPTDNQDRLVLIDFEYCSYNYRGFELANHFLEWTYDYTKADYPHFYELPNNYPSKNQQLLFIQEYKEASECASEPEEILEEIKTFSLASHMFWGLWACANAPLSQIPFGYWDYAVSRLDSYFRLKEELLCSQPIAVKRNLHDCD